jgi:peroxiredoxin (alkyl hydroperoxide reductase subunit C)
LTKKVVNDLPLGRKIDEALRMVNALQFNEEQGQAYPANWNSDKKGLTTTREGIASSLAET